MRKGYEREINRSSRPEVLCRKGAPRQQSNRLKACNSIINGDPTTGTPQSTLQNPPKHPPDRTPPVAASELKTDR